MWAPLTIVVFIAACGRWGFGDPDGGTSPTADGEVPSVFVPLTFPGGGDADSIAVAPSAPAVIYLSAGGRLFRSADRGVSWTDCKRPGGTWLVAVSPTDENTVYVGEEAGLDVSNDGCRTWTRLLTQDIGALAVSSTDVIVGTAAGLSRLRQGTFTALPSNADGYDIADIVIAGDGSIVVASYDIGLLRSTNDGATFTPINSGLATLAVESIALPDPASSGTMVVQTALGIYVSTTAGSSWMAVPSGSDGRGAVAADPTDSSFVVANTWHGMIRSYSGGTSFDGSDPRTAVLDCAWTNRFAFDTVIAGRVYAATNRGVFAADDHQLFWYPANVGLDAYVINQLAEVPGTNTILAATPGGLAASTDGGTTWTIEASGMEGGDSNLLTVHVPAANPSILLTGGSSWLWRSANGGRTFSAVATMSAVDRYSLTATSSEWPRFWIGTGSRLWHTDDGGAMWYQNDLPGAHWVTDLLGAVGELWVSTEDGVFHTDDDGTSFELVSHPIVDRGAWGITRASDGTVLVGTRAGVYATSSASLAWTSRGLTDTEVWDLVVDGGRWFAATDRGVFVSADNGASWQELPGLAQRRPQTLLVRANGELLVGTYGYGVFRTTL